MSTRIGGQSSAMDKVCIGLSILMGIILFAALSQPAWRGDAMVAELKSDCQKQHGVMLEHKKMFGTEYECAPYLDKGTTNE